MNIKAASYTNRDAGTVRLRCPVCRQRGAFETVGQDLLVLPETVVVGQRRCPDPNCYTHVFFVMKNGSVTVSYPAERIDFDATDIPAGILKTFEEAITCHANQCFVAAAIMVRKTLEELCRERGATGKNLKERITALGTKVVLPAELLQGLERFLSVYDMTKINQDLLKELYENLIDDETKHDLGEVYTPDWLVELTLREELEKIPSNILKD